MTSLPRPFLALLALGVAASIAAADLAETLAGSLVQRDGSELVPAGKDALEGKKYIAVYYSAHWCPPCRQFTPALAKFYDSQREQHPEFEMIFVSGDRDAAAMAEYMNWGEMNFLAVAYDKVKESSLRQHAARGIPYLIVLDAEGKPLIEKPAGETWMSPVEALAQLEKLLES